MDDCLFCKIIRGEIPSAKIYENEHTFAFLDIHPNNHGHTLVIPKEHHRNILDLPEGVLRELYSSVRKVSIAVYGGMGAAGLNINMNNERSAGQLIFHTHVHIIPRFEEDGLRVWSRNVPYKNGEMDSVAEKIKKALK